MAKTTKKKSPRQITDILQDMPTKGIEHKIPGTDRLVHLRTIDAPKLLRSGKVPDILTPLVVRAVYQDVSDREVREFMKKPGANVEEALQMAEAIDYIVENAIVSGAKVSDLTMGERRWIFRLAMGEAELLATFRYDEDADVESVDESNEVQQTAERGDAD